MKHTMLSKEKADYLFDHLLGGFEGSHVGIKQLKETGLAADQEYVELLEKNAQRLIDRIKEFKIAQKLVCFAFIFIFGYLQISGDDLEMRRGRRGTRSGRRKSESELPKYV